MIIIGADHHPNFRTIAFLMEEIGECGEQELNHSDGQAERVPLRGSTVAVPPLRVKWDDRRCANPRHAA